LESRLALPARLGWAGFLERRSIRLTASISPEFIQRFLKQGGDAELSAVGHQNSIDS
jgi:hypothetical protein